MKMTTENKNTVNLNEDEYLEGSWSIRPCFIYKEEYNDCKSFKARFHQYFINGSSTDCSQWGENYQNCVLYEEKKDLEAGKKVIENEKERRLERLKAHYKNDIWKKRSKPPEDWSKPLPEWLIKKNENTFLDLKAKGIATDSTFLDKSSYCVIM